MRWRIAALLLSCIVSGVARAGEVRHRFLGVDESRHKLHLVDQLNPANDWTIDFPSKGRDIQLIGNDRVLISAPRGYWEIDLRARKLVKKLERKDLGGTQTVRRRPDGTTVIGRGTGGGITLHELDRTDRVVRTAVFEKTKPLRLMRLTSRGTVVFGTEKHVHEVDLDGKVLGKTEVPGARYIYHAMRRAGGGFYVTTGYSAFAAAVDSHGKIEQKFGLAPAARGGLQHKFYCGMQVLANGNVVVCNWTGHGAKDSRKGPQLVEFAPDGSHAWTWHEPERAGTLHAAIVLDGLDTSELHLELDGVLAPVRSRRR
ncbi:MAG: hypothetical protein ACYS9X_15860 [Planctomycetota bacterium]|jgi:hypothetical protein